MSKINIFNFQLEFMVQTAISLCTAFLQLGTNSRKLLEAPKENIEK